MGSSDPENSDSSHGSSAPNKSLTDTLKEGFGKIVSENGTGDAVESATRGAVNCAVDKAGEVMASMANSIGKIVTAPSSENGENTSNCSHPNDLISQAPKYLGVFKNYIETCQNVKSANQFLDANQKYFGSPILYVDEFGTSFLVGTCAGYASKNALKATALCFGFGYLGLMALRSWGYNDYVRKVEGEMNRFNEQVNLTKRATDVISSVTSRDLVSSILRYGIPNASGLAVGFFYGFRMR